MLRKSAGQGWRAVGAPSDGLLPLQGVNDVRPGWVRCVPDEAEIEVILQHLAERMPGCTPRQIKGTFATGGGGVTPLVLQETLDILGKHLDRLSS